MRMRHALLTMAVACMATPVAAGACPKVVFFDLGDTLLQAGAGGLFVVKPGARETVDALKAQGTRVAVITNVPAGFTRAQLDALMADPSFLDEFEVLLMSSEAPAAKPNPAIYTHAHGLLSDAPPITQTAFVGETIAEIANTATSPSSGARADFTIAPDQLPQLVPLIQDQCRLHANGFESEAKALSLHARAGRPA
jgi:hypothetical protein